jgi:hypothetical protein
LLFVVCLKSITFNLSEKPKNKTEYPKLMKQALTILSGTSKVCRLFAMLLIFLSGSYLPLAAQDIQWSDGPLSWDDFGELGESEDPSSLYFFLNQKMERIRKGSEVLIYWKAIAGLPEEKLAVKPGYKSPHFLMFHQTLFDMVELHRRRFQFALYRVGSSFEAAQVRQSELERCQYFMGQLYYETQVGADTAAVSFWHELIRYELSQIDRVVVPDYKKSAFGYGLEIGLGSSMFTGEVGNRFASAFDLYYGFQFAYKKYMLLLDATIGFTSVSESFYHQELWEEDQRLTYFLVNAALGYRFRQARRLHIVPFAGIGFTEFAFSLTDEEQDAGIKPPKVGELVPVAGVRFDYRFRVARNYIPQPWIKRREITETIISGRFYIARMSSLAKQSGYSVNLGVSIGGFGRFLNLPE